MPDISEAINGNLFEIAEKYFDLNPQADRLQVQTALTNLLNIPRKQIGAIELSHDLDIDVVTEIFIRINSEGVVLSQADFAMSKIAVDTRYGGNELRKAIDYFCHLAIAPEFYRHIEDNDKEFAATDYFNAMRWLRNENEDLYDPDYTDMIRVAFTSQFNRGKLADLVSLLSGRNFEQRIFEEAIAEESFGKLKIGVMNFMNRTNFQKFLMIVKSAGFISPKLIRSQNALNFAYILYLKLRELKVNDSEIEQYVKRWLVYSILTGRYSASPESTFDYDIKQISSRSFAEYLKEKEDGELSDAFWDVILPEKLDTSVASSPYFLVFLASQVKANDKGFLSKDVLVGDLIALRGDIHHLFPKDYLKRNGLMKGRYNQIANYVYMQTEINIRVGNKSPKEYFGLINKQIADNIKQISGITTEQELADNLRMNCIPSEIVDMELGDYDAFLATRQRLMAEKMKEYYFSL